MSETPEIDRDRAGDGWRSVYIASPRRLDGAVTYAMIVKRDGGEETIARNVTIARALVIALGPTSTSTHILTNYAGHCLTFPRFLIVRSGLSTENVSSAALFGLFAA